MASIASNRLRSQRPVVIYIRRLLGSWQGRVSILLLAVVVVSAITAPIVTEYNPNAIDISIILSPPTADHLFGTDQLGRDLFARVLYGARVSLLIVFGSLILAFLVGCTLGLASGWAGGVLDAVLMRTTDALLAFPMLILALSVIAVLGPDLQNAILAIGITKMPGFARVVRAEVLTLRDQDFVRAAEVAGRSTRSILWRHIWPNASGSVLVYGSLAGSQVLITESALSFLGLGVQPPTPSWGGMVAEGMLYWTQWWMSFFPGLAIFITVLGFNLLGDAIRDALDSRLPGRK